MYIVFGEQNSPTLTGNDINQLVVKITLMNWQFSYQIHCFENTTFSFNMFLGGSVVDLQSCAATALRMLIVAMSKDWRLHPRL